MSLTFIMLAVFSYFLGSVPFGLLFGRLFADVDVREFGSGNIGATNVNRVLGRKLGAATLLCDALKGLLPVVLALVLLRDKNLAAWVGVCALLGHIFPIYLKFKGGKGVATMFGVLFPLSFIPSLFGLVAWIATVKISKISSLGALIACITIPTASVLLDKNWELSLIILGIMVLVVYRHKENIQRLRSGAEK